MSLAALEEPTRGGFEIGDIFKDGGLPVEKAGAVDIENDDSSTLEAQNRARVTPARSPSPNGGE